MPPFNAIILYEDQQGANGQFGLHKFVMSCVFDAINGERHLIERRVEGRPLKGDSKLLESTRRDLNRIAADGRRVIAVFDNDRIRRLLKLPSTATDEDVCEAVKTDCEGDRTLLTVALLKENTESVLKAARECNPEIEQPLFEQAVTHKELFARDILFTSISRSAKRAVRDCILAKMPSMAALVATIREVLD
jgi:hypothetical protein